MSKNIENKLLPKLRFPHFAGEWKKDELGNLIEIKGRIGYRGYTINDIVGIGEGAISLSPSNISDNNLMQFEKSTYITWKKYNESPEIQLKDGYTVLVKTGSSYGKAALIKNLPEKTTINPQLVVLKPNKIDKHFLFYIVSNAAVQKQIEAAVVGGAIPTLSQESISKFEVLIPPDKNKSEQKKIAECLSSLDEVITAESQKLEVLKEHKKGLLQNLFPQEGETVPKVRFKEFEDSGEWELRALGELVDVLMCKRIFAEETNENSGVPFFKIGTLGGKPDAFISHKLFKEYKFKYNYPRKGEVLITCSGTVGKCLIYDGQDAYYQDSNIVWLDNEMLQISNELLFHVLSNVKWDILNSTTITRIYGSDLRGLKIQYPKVKEEQDMVASCLSSCDKLTSEQSMKVEELKHHKKGLLQGLFP